MTLSVSNYVIIDGRKNKENGGHCRVKRVMERLVIALYQEDMSNHFLFKILKQLILPGQGDM